MIQLLAGVAQTSSSGGQGFDSGSVCSYKHRICGMAFSYAISLAVCPTLYKEWIMVKASNVCNQWISVISGQSQVVSWQY